MQNHTKISCEGCHDTKFSWEAFSHAKFACYS